MIETLINNNKGINDMTRETIVEKMKQVINYDTDMGTLIVIEDLNGYKQNGYVLDYDESDKPGVEPRFVFEDYASGEISEEYFVEFKSAMTICDDSKYEIADEQHEKDLCNKELEEFLSSGDCPDFLKESK